MKIKLTKQIKGSTAPALVIVLDYTAQTFSDLSGNPSAATSRVCNWELEGRRLSLIRQGWQETIIDKEKEKVAA